MVAMLILSSGSSPPPPLWFILAAFVGTWVLVAFAISRFSGWIKLAGYYPADHLFDGQLIRFQGAQFRAATNYNGCLNFGGNYEGMYMVPMFPFKLFHPPLMIPWSEITAHPVKLMRFWNFVELRFQRAPDIPVRIKAQLAQKLADASMGRFSITTLTSAGN